MLLASVVFSSCAKYSLIYETKSSPNISQEGNYYVFENDTVKVVYSFWAGNGGTLSYTLYNKLSIPIYVDWKKCTFIRNGEKKDYWHDKVNIKSDGVSSTYSGYTFGGNVLSATVSRGNAVAAKDERVIFVAPKSSFTRVNIFYLYTGAKQQLSTPDVDLTSYYSTKKTIKGKSKDYQETNSPASFRNFMSISTTESFEKEYYIDNSFYVNKITELNKKDFIYRVYDKETTKAYDDFFIQNPKWFYANIEN